MDDSLTNASESFQLELFLEKNRVGSANMFQIIRFGVKKE